MRILIADSDPAFSQQARFALKSEAVIVEVANGMQQMLELATSVRYEALVIDLALAGGNGANVIAQLRRRGVVAPVLALTPDGALSPRLDALRFGADDCLSKPVMIPELVARVHALLRRNGRQAGDCLEVEDLVLHCTERRAFRSNEVLSLTAREFAALEHLVRHHGKPVSSAELLAHLWHGEDEPRDNFIAVLMMRLRKKIDDGRPVKLVHTVRGVGYLVGLREE